MKKLIILASLVLAGIATCTTTASRETDKKDEKQKQQIAEVKKESREKISAKTDKNKRQEKLLNGAGIAAAETKAAPAGDYYKKRIPGYGTALTTRERSYKVKQQQWNTESYDHISANGFKAVKNSPLSTFSVDVDTASYANIRRFIRNGSLPPRDAVRIEECINYFSYDYPQPEDDKPFAVYTEYSSCPWNKKHRLLHIGLKGKTIKTEDLPLNNLTFLIDVSGSMRSSAKLPLLKKAFSLLVKKMRPEDKIAIAVYAGAAGLVLPSTAGTHKEKILAALNNLRSGGSTAGGAGIKLAYKTARNNFIKGGNNRIIIATDGDFNIGPSSDAAMVRLIEKNRDQGIFLTTLGFGMGNYKDSKMEKLADKGNGNYAYIDSLLEAKKVLVTEMGGTLFTIAKDVKLQLEFNPALVKAYRLVGYENRILAKEDFNDDQKDAGEIGAGHTVTALYEIITSDSGEELTDVDPLKYQKQTVRTDEKYGNEILTVKLRYKLPTASKSKLLKHPVASQPLSLAQTSDSFRFAAAVAEFAMVLRESKYKNEATFTSALKLAQDARGRDPQGLRGEFIRLIHSAQLLQRPGS
ncbi:MAG TPA: VWA domain-containing protein [Spirochaetota bacterium]|nr:VWA domain-containing protein [Spirochaetota bacterium]